MNVLRVVTLSIKNTALTMHAVVVAQAFPQILLNSFMTLSVCKHECVLVFTSRRAETRQGRASERGVAEVADVLREHGVRVNDHAGVSRVNVRV